MNLRDILSPFYVWKRAFEKPYSINTLSAPRPGAPRYRGFHKNDLDKCIGCGTCAEICQNATIDMVPVREAKDGDSGLRPRVDYGRCCWCALCVDICPSGSLTMSNAYTWVEEGLDLDVRETYCYIPGTIPSPGITKNWATNVPKVMNCWTSSGFLCRICIRKSGLALSSRW